MAQFLRTENFRTFLRTYPITSCFIAVNLTLFLLMEISGSSTSHQTLVRFGAYYKPYVLGGEWYRLLTSAFLHIGLTHLFFNSFVMFIFVAELEKIIGSVRFFFFYLLAGIGGSLCTLLFSPTPIVAGASGAIFGVFGAFLYILRYRKDLIDPRATQIIFPLIVINLIFTFLDAKTSITGHLGGFISGGLLAFLFIQRRRHRWW